MHSKVLVLLDDLENLPAVMETYAHDVPNVSERTYLDGDPAASYYTSGLVPAPATWVQAAELSRQEHEVECDQPPAGGSCPRGCAVLDVDAEGRAYVWETYNTRARWDWWVVGGRWAGDLPVREHSITDLGAHEPSAPDGAPLTGWTGTSAAQLKDIDLPALQASITTTRARMHQLWTDRIAALEPYTLQQAARHHGQSMAHGGIYWEYANQPARLAAAEVGMPQQIWDQLLAGVSYEEFLTQGLADVLGCSALVDIDGSWTDLPDELLEPDVLERISDLPADTWLVVVDCHS